MAKQRNELLQEFSYQFANDVLKGLDGFTPDEQLHILTSYYNAYDLLIGGADLSTVDKSVFEPLTLKYRRKYSYYRENEIESYFLQQSSKWLEFQKLNNETPRAFDDREYLIYLVHIGSLLYKMRDKLLSVLPAEGETDFIPLTADMVSEMDSKNKDFTARRRALFLHYLDKKFKFNSTGDKKPLAEVAHFLTGNSESNLYKHFLNPLDIVAGEKRISSENALKSDLQFVKKYFERLDSTDIVAMIDKDINSF